MTWWNSFPEWQSGSWKLQLRDHELADIAFGGRLALRSVRAVVRDSDWATVPLIVDGIESVGNRLTLSVRSDGRGSSFHGFLTVEADAEKLRVTVDLESVADYATNRTGLVVLHPASVSGADLEVLHGDGTVERTRFPQAVSPHQPVLDIAGLSWDVGGLRTTVEFDGDVFEMEDQRNWTDASFKTYSRPLALPFPYTVRAGERVRQSVTIRTSPGSSPRRSTQVAVPIRLRAGGSFPMIGLTASNAPDPEPRSGSKLAPSFLLVELDLATTNWRAALTRAGRTRFPLDVRLTLDPNDPEQAAAAIQALRVLPVTRVAAFQASGTAAHVTDHDALSTLRDALASGGKGMVDVDVVGGARSHFTEVNRERHRIPRELDGLAFTVTPLFHDVGTHQLVESIEMQRLVASQGVGFADGRPVHIGPIALRPRFNNVATGVLAGPTRDDLVEGYGAEFTGSADPRQSAPELASWTVASASALAVPGVASLTWFEDWGSRGVRSAHGSDHPVAAAITAISALVGGTLLHGEVADPRVWAVGSRMGGRDRVLIANIDDVPRRVDLDLIGHSLTSVVVPAGRFLVHEFTGQ